MFNKSKGILMREPGQNPSSSGMQPAVKLILGVAGVVVLLTGIVFALCHFFPQHKLALQNNEALLARLRDDLDPELFRFHPAIDGLTLIAEDGQGKRVNVYVRSLYSVCVTTRFDNSEFTTVRFGGNVVTAGSDGDACYVAADSAVILVPLESLKRLTWFREQLSAMTTQRHNFLALESNTGK